MDTDQANARLTTAEFNLLATACAPTIPFVTLRAIARAESGFHPYALSLNYPHRIAYEHGLVTGQIIIARQPRTLAEARAWTQYLLKRGRSVSIGLMQINTEHATELGLTVDQLFDPCTNLNTGARLLARKYQRAATIRDEGQEALHQALSEYNSGSDTVGFANGYVSIVVNGGSN